MKKVLTIAGSDSSGGAGIQADLKTMLAHGVFGMSAITALTAQNTTGVADIMEATPQFLANEIDSVFEDIFPDAVKVGMLGNAELTRVVSDKIKQYKPKNIVVDPVMVSTSGKILTPVEAMDIVANELFTMADIITPNIPEAEVLCGMKIKNAEDVEKAGTLLGERYPDTAVLIKGGHATEEANDLLIMDGNKIWIEGERIDSSNNHGTGCTLSSAIASNLAKGLEMTEAVRLAKRYVADCMRAGLNLGKGNGPLDHGAVLSYEYFEK
ncbi:MAG: bifunctional hydroxymethylpyrimidine kinase/phosphomethylpyrimidine kinase [Lachnospiraceae bacterium]|nr:bifunctional hydroxymethylpyrimidine kinase/phosphomethylpyrimidine kinase [Lachnospiraceae bacterium]